MTYQQAKNLAKEMGVDVSEVPLSITGEMILRRALAALEQAAYETDAVPDWAWWANGIAFLHQHLHGEAVSRG